MHSRLTYRKTAKLCNVACFIQGVVPNLPPFLFIPLKLLYDLSYTQIGTLILLNFLIQLGADLLFGKPVHRYGYRPFIVGAHFGIMAGLVIFALAPWIMPGFVYIPLVVGTVFFACGAGTIELVINPVITSIPSEDKSSSMAFLHIFYALGLLAVALVTTLFIFFFGNGSWYIIVLVWAVIPLANGLLFRRAPLPVIEAEHKTVKMGTLVKNRVFIIASLAIFFSAATEIMLVQWGSSYLEQGLGLDKIVGDVGGLCTYAVMMGVGRIIFAAQSKKLNIHNAMIWGGAVSIIAYAMLALAPNVGVVMAAFGLVGFCTCMMWPGTLLVASQKLQFAGVLVFGALCAVGDIGSAIAGQAIGVISDFFAANAPESISITPEQFGLRIAIAASVLIPVLTTIFQFILKKTAPYKQESSGASDSQMARD
jgi:fucose permease